MNTESFSEINLLDIPVSLNKLKSALNYALNFDVVVRTFLLNGKILREFVFICLSFHFTRLCNYEAKQRSFLGWHPNVNSKNFRQNFSSKIYKSSWGRHILNFQIIFQVLILQKNFVELILSCCYVKRFVIPKVIPELCDVINSWLP